MSQVVAILFDDPYKADEARAMFLRLEGEGQIELDETAVVSVRPDGSRRMTQDIDQRAKGQKVGHVAGIVAAAVTGVFPLILAGTLVGRLVGRLRDRGITDKFIKEVSKGLQPGTSCLIVMGHSDAQRRRRIIERLAPLGGRILESDLPPEVEEEIESQLETQPA